MDAYRTIERGATALPRTIQLLRLLFLGLLCIHLIPGQLAETLLQRAQADLARIKPMVEDGTLAKSALTDAEEKVADAEDYVTLSKTLYSTTRVEDLTQQQMDDMVAAATRRVERASARLDARHKLLDMGIVSQAEMQGVKSELYSRQLALDLAHNRVSIWNDVRQMAAEEERLQSLASHNAMIRYDGSAAFNLSRLPAIEKAFKARFNQELPVSAVGETVLHRSMGLDHRNRVDVALNPDAPEGVWLRNYLENAHLSYLAFRNAVVGAATGAHIHIGTGSTRLLP